MLEDIATDFFEKDLRSFQSKTKIHIAEDELEEMLVTAQERHIERGGEKEEERRRKGEGREDKKKKKTAHLVSMKQNENKKKSKKNQKKNQKKFLI